MATTYTPTKKGKKQISGGILYSTDSDGILALSNQIWDEEKQRKVSEFGFISSNSTITITEVTQPLIDADDSTYTQDQLGLWDLKGAEVQETKSFMVVSNDEEVTSYTTKKDGEEKAPYTKQELVPSIDYLETKLSSIYSLQGSTDLITLLSKDLAEENGGNVYNINSLGVNGNTFQLDGDINNQTPTPCHITIDDEKTLNAQYDSTQGKLFVDVNNNYRLTFQVSSVDTTTNVGDIDPSKVTVTVLSPLTDTDSYIDSSIVYIGDNIVCCEPTKGTKWWDNLHGIIAPIEAAQWDDDDFPFNEDSGTINTPDIPL